jgi:hypothetical protein
MGAPKQLLLDALSLNDLEAFHTTMDKTGKKDEPSDENIGERLLLLMNSNSMLRLFNCAGMNRLR